MNSNLWLANFLKEHGNASMPDSRPLYAYKCRDEAYDWLKALVAEMFAKVKTGDSPLNYTPLFCLFASETWRRRHAGGPWKWDTVFNEIHAETPTNYAQIYVWIQDGLAYWKRPVLKSAANKHLYLITIACEGGLPLLLLQKEDACLNRFFKNLLQAYHHERALPNCDVIATAKRLASYLPKSLQQEIVYKLGGDLVKKVVDLQYMVPEAADPIVALDKKRPNWRDDLPLPLGEKTVELLLNNLVNEAKTLIISERQRIRWRRLLLGRNGEWQVEQRLELPKSFSGAVLQKWINRETLVPRLRILLQTTQGITPIALLTRLRGEGDKADYRCEDLKRTGVKLSGARALADTRLLVSDGDYEWDLTVTGGEGWGPLPWIFREKDGQWEYLKEGSARCKDECVRVLSPLGGSYDIKEGECRLIATMPEIEREVWECNGTVQWTHPELGTCRIVCASQDATEEVLSLEGGRVYSEIDTIPIFLGLPGVYATTPDGIRRQLDLPMQWRPYTGGGLTWSDDPPACLGDVWLRYLDSEGNQMLRRRTRIVPKTWRVEIDQMGRDQTLGRLCLSGLAGGQVSCVERSDCEFKVDSREDFTFIHCFTEVGLPITDFEVRLLWSEGRSLEMRLPFPQTGGAFIFAGKVLPDGDQVPVARVNGVQAVAQAPLSGRKFFLSAKIKSNAYHLNQMWLREQFEVGRDGRGIFYLHRIQERLASLLALTGELDAWAMVEILDAADRCFARLKVQQFDMALEPDKENQRVLVPQSCLNRLDEGWEERVFMRMVPLWAPNREAIVLDKFSDQAAWNIPENLEVGPWWVLGEDGDWARFRPLLWSRVGEIESGDSPLENAIRQGNPKIRKQMYSSCMEQIAMDANHSDWAVFFDLLHLVRPYPASALDLFSTAIECPEAMVMALLGSGDDDFESVWSLSLQLPFSWYLLPVNAWFSSAARYFGFLREALAEIEHGEEMVWGEFEKFKDRVSSQRPFFRQVCDWISQKIFPEKSLQNSEFILARSCPEMITGFIETEEQNFQSRHDAEELYPEGPNIMRWSDEIDFPNKHKYQRMGEPYRPVRCAPFVAAHISLEGHSYDENLLFELRNSRGFDSDWFNATYAYALCLGLSQIK